MENLLTIEQCKAIAQAEAAGNDYFVFAGKVWDISEDDARELAKEWAIDKTYINTLTDEQLIEWLEETQCELEYDDSYNANYVVLTDSEADEKAEEYIKESLWAFNSNFLSNVTGFNESIFEAIQDNGKCESNNSVILQMVENNPNAASLDDLVRDAVSSDGRGHFMSSYDGHEAEFNCFDYTGINEYLFVYRVN